VRRSSTSATRRAVVVVVVLDVLDVLDDVFERFCACSGVVILLLSSGRSCFAA
jgi:hypothetical protein